MPHHTDAPGEVGEFRLSWEQQVARLEAACRDLGVERGRARELMRLLKEFLQEGKRSRNHYMAANESFEVTDIHELWRLRLPQFPGLGEAIRQCLSSGAVVPEDELPRTASNKPRNDAFVYWVAGRLLDAGVTVLAVDGIGRGGGEPGGPCDVLIEWEGAKLAIECKRPYSPSGLGPCLRRAVSQIRRRGVPGVATLDCSRVVRPMAPEGTVLEAASPETAWARLADSLQGLLATVQRPSPRWGVLGLVLFARAPVMIVAASRIWSVTGRPYEYLTAYSVTAAVIWHDGGVPETANVPAIWRRVAQSGAKDRARRTGASSATGKSK
jgi:hypothetical protein